MKKTTFILILLLIANLIETKSQEIKFDTISIYDHDSIALYRFPRFKFQQKNIEESINKLFSANIISEFLISDSSKSDFLDLSYEDLNWIESSYFSILHNRNSIVSIEFVLNNRTQPIPYTFIKTIDVKNQKILELNDILDTALIAGFYKMINEKIDKDIDESIGFLDQDVEIKDNKGYRDYLIDCYKGYRNQKHFNFYVEELNKSVIIKPSCCCRIGVDGFSSYYVKFLDISRYLKNEYRQRIQ